MADTSNPNALAGTLLTRGQVIAAAIAAGANQDIVIDTSGYSTLLVEADLTATAAGDLGIQVNPVSDIPGAQVTYPINMPVIQSVGPTLSGGVAYEYALYDVEAQNRVRLRITNNNVAGKVLNVSWRLQ